MTYCDQAKEDFAKRDAEIAERDNKSAPKCSDERPCIPCYTDVGQCLASTNSRKKMNNEKDHDLEECFQHFLAYTGKIIDPDERLKLAYEHGNDRGIESIERTLDVFVKQLSIAFRQEFLWRMEDSECGGDEVMESWDMKIYAFKNNDLAEKYLSNIKVDDKE